jgi:hypothetical protein
MEYKRNTLNCVFMVIVNESGAQRINSRPSASEPLSEFVKVDPKSIGAGQYSTALTSAPASSSVEALLTRWRRAQRSSWTRSNIVQVLTENCRLTNRT